MTTHIDLQTLPEPNIIEPLSYQDILTERKQRFIEYAPAYSDALELESDPINVWLQVESYREALLRQRINDAAASNLLAKASHADLQHLGAFYGVLRLNEESDDDYRLRIRDNTIASSTAGSDVHYRKHALNAAPTDILDVSVQSLKDGLVTITVLVKKEHDVDEVVAKAASAVTASDVKMLTDTVDVNKAELIYIDVAADVYLQENTSERVFNELQASLASAWEEEARLGWDLTPSWLSAQLHKKGVRDVVLRQPEKLQSIDKTQCAVMGTVTLKLCQ
ncbi:baseplate J/gp47 family protein [Pseudoalteromonas sp. MMG012]|uniref:baseplate assembly protein n=1 Tax=Pseudoalteromonas sp. MMG012 TaxID=2822686 RepID=UPI001B39F127|nr:baseplate J/gp47 family protein [Pseudoalteromonas sp. MMG012]MBQ4850995.1 baseplate J/gp47 family protein [Pseudoalteromonas sp. MMG012]